MLKKIRDRHQHIEYVGRIGEQGNLRATYRGGVDGGE